MHTIKATVGFHCVGTPRQRRAEQIADVANALREVERLMGIAAPHGRDYFDEHDLRPDREEHERRLRLVEELRRQYWQEAEEVVT